jgi:NAD(P)-dependent dehydrogenase (short-subunit alcohol dehydrogenase family)
VSRIFITGSADGLGQTAARRLVAAGHDVVVHGRSPQRADEALAAVPGARAAVHGDLSSVAQMRAVAEQANALGRFDAVIHNAGVYLGPRRETADGLEHVFAINVLAPYVLTAQMLRPERLVHLTSGMHRSGQLRLDDLQWTRRPWDDTQAYCDSKLHDVLLALACARRWPEARSNAVDPGWIATRMGGPAAPGGLEEGTATQVLLAGDDAPPVTGGYWYREAQEDPNPAAADPEVQEALLAACAELSGVPVPD